MKKLLKIVIVFYCMLNLISVNIFASSIQNKKEKGLNLVEDTNQNYFDIVKSINGVAEELYNQALIKKSLMDYNIVDKKSSYDKKIKKGDFVKAVLKIIGVTDEFAEYVKYATSIEYDSSKTAFSTWVRKKGEKELHEYYEEKDLYPYILLINVYGIVSKGDFKDTKNSYPDDDIELEECLHIMNKCLSEKLPSGDIISIAEKNGLIKSTDEMLNREEKTLNYEEFCTLLYRMLNHHMGHYFKYYDSDWKYSFYRKEKIDEKGYRYIDYLDYLKNQDVEGFYVPQKIKDASNNW